MKNSSFTRKIIYIVIIACLLIPLSLVSRPATRDSETNDLRSGGKLATLRDKHELSQSKLAEIDPASETMKLASLGLRGVAVNMLWMQAIEHKKKERWNQFESTLNALVKIQPNFIRVWEYQAHNMAYNISMEFDDYEYRYHWVKKGINFLTKGLAPNYRDHRMTDNLGFFTGMKIGVADEKSQFRRMFRDDKQFRADMEEHLVPQSYQTRHGYDNWKMAYQWYNRSRILVEDQSARPYSSDMMFYMRRPAQLRNLGGAQQKEFPSDEAIREVWASAHREWMEYGDQPLGNTLGQVISLEAMVKTRETLEQKRAELDALAPEGTRQAIQSEILNLIEITPEEQAALDMLTDQRSDEQEILARRVLNRLNAENQEIDMRVAREIPEENQLKARRIGDEIFELTEELKTIDRYQGTINYRYWRIRTKAEMGEEAIRAHKLLYDAEELARQSIFDDEYELDTTTGEKKITREGSISTYESAFKKFGEVLTIYPSLMDGELADNLKESLGDYEEMLEVTGLDWPNDFPLQAFVDRINEEGDDSLPSTLTLLQRRLDRGEITEEEYERLVNGEEPDSETGNGEEDSLETPETTGSDGDEAEMKDNEAGEGSDEKQESGVGEKKSDAGEQDLAAPAALVIAGPGLVKEKPDSEPFVEVEGGFMVPYTTTIPGTDVTFEMVPIPGGTFKLGSPDSEKKRGDDEGPQIEVTIEPFWMGKHEVTWAEYKPFMRLDKVFKEFKRRKVRLVDDDTKIDAVTAPSALYDPSFTFDAGEDPDQPCATIAQFAAKQYTKYLSLLTGTYYRLPYEAEWEYACRGGSTTAYHFGDDPSQLKDYGWFIDNSDEYRMAVGTLKPNQYGLYDMYGNASEWVLGQYVEDGYKRLEGKSALASDTFVTPTELHPRVCRGGSFEMEAEDCRSAARQVSVENWRDEDPNTPRSPWWFTDSPALGVGFRLMRPLREPESRAAKEVHWEADLEDIEYDASNRIRDNGKGAYGIVDPELPKAIKDLSEDK
jgi:formylglycine-generating enzyme required for sulfatase activity